MSPDQPSGSQDEAEAPPPAFEPDHAAELAADLSNIDALIEQARAAVLAEAAEPASGGDQARSPEPEPADDTAAVASLQARGYEVTPPAPPPPPPDPYATLHAELEPLVGSAEQYQTARAQALAALPPLPGDTDPDWQAKFDAHAQAVRARDEAASTLARFDHARQTAGTAREWARGRVLAELGSALSGIAQTYGLTPEQAARVQQPKAMSDAVSAVVEARDAYWQQQIDAQAKHWQGEVKRASSDRQTARLDALGRGPALGAPPAGRPSDGPLAAIFSGSARPSELSEDLIERAKRGELRGLDLSDR